MKLPLYEWSLGNRCPLCSNHRYRGVGVNGSGSICGSVIERPHLTTADDRLQLSLWLWKTNKQKRSQSHKSVMNYYWKRVFWIDRYLTELECAETLQELNWLQLKPSQRFDLKWSENEKAEWWHVHKEILTHWCEGIQKYITLNVTSHKHKHLQVTLHRFVSVKIITAWKKLKNQF